MIINFIDRVKFAFNKDRELASALQKILGFYPHKLEFYRVALAHKSLVYRNAKGRPVNNERLEYLGDAILEAVVSDLLFHRYPNRREGFLTSTRSKIVQRSSLNHLATEMGLIRLIKTSGSANTHNNNIGGNAFEALIGAIYLDRGYAISKWFIEKRIMGRLLDIDGVAQKEVNFKSKLLEWTQKNRIQSHYSFEEHEDRDTNSPVFSSSITIEGLLAGTGRGYSKKESQQAAAKDALTKLRREPQFADSIFRAKEKRTAMEADEICALPKIEEIEAEISKGQKSAQSERPASRHAKPAPRAKEQKPTTAATSRKPEQRGDNSATTVPTVVSASPTAGGNDATTATDAETAAKPSRKRNHRRHRAVATTPATANNATQAESAAETTTTERVSADTPNATPKARRTKSHHTPRQAADEQSDKKRKGSVPDYEDIVSRAEASAFSEGETN